MKGEQSTGKILRGKVLCWPKEHHISFAAKHLCPVISPSDMGDKIISVEEL